MILRGIAWAAQAPVDALMTVAAPRAARPRRRVVSSECFAA